MAVGDAVEEFQFAAVDQLADFGGTAQNARFSIVSSFNGEVIPEGAPGGLPGLIIEDGWLEAHHAAAFKTIGKDPDFIGGGLASCYGRFDCFGGIEGDVFQMEEGGEVFFIAWGVA